MEITQGWFEDFFSLVGNGDLLKRRESTTIEFKEVFNWSDKKFKSNIACTASAFSNNEGGVIIFGIADKPHFIVGVEGFDEIDEADISMYFKEHFSPVINFSKHTFDYNGKLIGCIQIYQATKKPIVCIKDSDKTHDSGIYFRYNAMTSRIKSGDLIYLLNQGREDVSNQWLNMIGKIATIGVGNVGLLNSTSGELLSSGDHTYLLDSAILDKIKFLDKYSESVEGSPAVKIIGEVDQSVQVIEKIKPIYEEDLYKAFLTESLVTSSSEYIGFILRQNTQYYPIYWFLNNDNIGVENRSEYISHLSVKFKNKNVVRVLDRLTDDSQIEHKRGKYTLSGTDLGPARKEFHDKLCAEEDFEIENENEAKLLLETIFSLEANGCKIAHIKKQLFKVYENFYPFEKNNLHYTFRWAITYLDNISNK